MTQIKDYLRFYLGCECKAFAIYDHTNKSGKWVDGTFKGINCYGGVEVQCRSIDGENWPGVDIYKSVDVKPILRLLSDMTEEEKIECDKQIHKYDSGYNRSHHVTDWAYRIDWLLKQQFDLFGLIEQGLAIDKTKIK